MNALAVLGGHIAALAGALGLAAFGVYAVRCGLGARALGAYEQALARDLAFVGGPRARVIVLAQGFLVLGLLGSAALLGTVAPLAFAVPVLAGPRLALLRARALRARAIEAQLDGWLTTLSNTLVATASLTEALAGSARTAQDPLRGELERVLSRVSLGTPLDRALFAFGERVMSPVVSTALLSLRVARNAGGELRPMLESTAAALRDMARFEGVVRAKTAEGKAQALAVSIVPAPLVVSIQLLSPEFFAPLGRSPAGYLVIAGAVLLWLSAIALAVKITAVDV